MEENKENEYKKYIDLMEARVKGNKTTGKSVKNLEKLCAEMKKLNRMIGQCYIKNEDQQYPMIGQKQMDAMKKSYETCIRYASLARKKDSETDILNSVHKVLLNDLRTISVLRETDVFAEKFRKEILHFKDLNIKTVGGAMSERIPLCYRDDDGTMHRGFFTKESIYQKKDFQKERRRMSTKTDTEAGYGPVIQRLAQSEAFVKFMESKSSEQVIDWFYTKVQSKIAGDEKHLDIKIDDFLDADPNRSVELWKEILTDYGQKTEDIVAPPEGRNGAERTKSMVSFLAKYFSNLGKDRFEGEEQDKQMLYEEAVGINKGDNFTDRNCAMSQIARLLGREELLASSVPMQICVGKDKVQGVFMEEAKGINFETWSLASRQEKLYPMTATALKDIADIQIIDYICGNVDRHMGNMIYQFDETGTLSHIVGIDHDLSMGEKRDIGGTSRLPKLHDMQVVSESMADRVLNMKQEELQLVLGGLDLSEKQKTAAWERVMDVQEWIKNAKRMEAEDYLKKPEKKKCYIVPDNAWSKIKMDNEGVENLFSVFSETQKVKDKETQKAKDKGDMWNNSGQEKKLIFLEGTYASPAFSEYGIEKNKETIDDIAKQLQGMFGKEGLQKRGKEFQDMYQNVQVLQSWFEAHKNFEDISMEDKQALQNAYAKTKESCQTYIRKHNPWTKIGKDRQNAATELMEFIGTQGIAIDECFALQEKTEKLISQNKENLKEFSKLSGTLKEELKTASAEEKLACQEAVEAQKNLYIMSTRKELSKTEQKEVMEGIKKLIAYDQVKGYVNENWQKQLKNKNHTPKDLRQFLKTEAMLREQARKEQQAEKQKEKVSEKGQSMRCN